MADTPGSDSATLATLYDGERRHPNRVDIHEAEAEFAKLQREFIISGTDWKDHPSRPESPAPSEHLPKDDLEKAPASAEVEERFDLRDYLTSSNDATQAAGIKHKHVGITWNDLEVTGIGGEGNKVIFPFCPGLVFRSLTSQ